MKRVTVVFSLFVLALTGCSKKNYPERTRTQSPVTTAPKTSAPTPLPPAATPDSSAGAKPVIIGSPLIVIDGSGNIITTKDKLPPDVAAHVNYTTLARSFTPDQKKNLVYRFKMIPPKVLYVPEGYVLKSARGKYVVYRKKFWYWQKADGLFYLDETYYR